MIPHTLAVTTLGARRARRPRQPRGRRHREVRRAPARRRTSARGALSMPFTEIENADRRHRARRARRRRRRRRPRERGRPHHGGREDDARDDGVHDPPHERRDLHADRGRAARRAAAPADGRRDNTESAAHRVHRVGRRHGTAPPPASPPPTAARPCTRSSTRATRPDDLARPGHIFPLRYREGGVLKRAGHTEAAVDLARLAGLLPGRACSPRS